MIETRFMSSHVLWQRPAFTRHPGAVLGAITAILALTLRSVFRWVSGPWRGR